MLEEHGLAKGDFDTAQKQITACRESGDLPLDICAEDASRETIGIEQIDSVTDIDAKVAAMVDQLRNHAHERYLPISPRSRSMRLAADFRHNHERIGFALADAELPPCRAGHGT